MRHKIEYSAISICMGHELLLQPLTVIKACVVTIEMFVLYRKLASDVKDIM